MAKEILTETIAPLVAPRLCAGCGNKIVPGSKGVYKYICPMCLARIGRLFRHREVMLRRFDGRARVADAAAFAAYQHESAVARLIMACKYGGGSTLAVHLGRLMGREMQGDPLLADVDVIMPVPIHWIKRLKRGYNQTEALACGLGRETGIPVARMLTARRNHRTQTLLTPEERRRNVKGIFRYRHTRRFHNARILLLDDVCTTGSTLAEAVNAIHIKDSVAEVSVLTFAAASSL